MYLLIIIAMLFGFTINSTNLILTIIGFCILLGLICLFEISETLKKINSRLAIKSNPEKSNPVKSEKKTDINNAGC